jgi:cytoskeletal protein CcmA (bactofilin family)
VSDDRNDSDSLERGPRKPASRNFPEPGAEEPGADTYEEMAQAKRGSLFNRVNQRFHDVLQNSRGTSNVRDPVAETREDPQITADDLAIRRARTVKPQRMTVPEGVIIDGSMSSGSETEIAGRIDGDVSVDGRLVLEPSALVSGNVRATSCRVDGLVEGRMECSQDLELGPNGRLNADVLAGRQFNVGGEVHGNIASGGLVHVLATAKVNGDIRARSIIVDEGAQFNGSCSMRPQTQRPARQKSQ